MSRVASIALVVAVFLLILDGLLYVGYQNALVERTKLMQQVSLVERTVGRLSTMPGALVGQEIFPRNVPGVELTDLVVKSAQTNNLQLVSMQSALGGTEKIGNNTYRAIKLNLALRGQPAQLGGFLANIENGSVRTWVVDNIQMNPAGGVWDISLEVTAYALPG